MSNTYTFTGRVVYVGNVEHVGQKNTPKLQFVVSDEADQYPTEIAFEAIGKSVDDIKRELTQGEQVTVSFDVGSRYWEKGDRWFTSAKAWKVEALGSKPAPRAEPDPSQESLPSHGDLDEEPPF